MKEEFSPEEINQIVRAARVWAPGFTQEQLQLLVDSQHRLGDSGFPEAAWGVVRLEQEKGIHCSEALDACQKLLQEKVGLERSVAAFEIKLKKVKGKVTQAQDKLCQIEGVTEQTREEVQAVQAERQKEEKGLATFRKKTEKEKESIEKEVEQCRQEADVTKEETATAGQLKAEVGKHGFSLDLVLSLSQEFAGCEDIRDKLAEGLERGLTLTKCNEEVAEQNETLQSDRKSLTEECQQLASHLSQLRADTAFEERIRHFYHRYQSAGPLMEWLASWSDIYFGRCGNPIYDAIKVVNRSIRGAYFWTEKQLGGTCPCCGYPRTLYDEGIYQALNLPIGEPYKLQLGE